MTTNNYISSSNYHQCSNPMIIKNLWRQQKDLLNKHPDGIRIIINDEDPLDVQADVEGPKETPFEGGIFRVKFHFGSEFPLAAPKVYFLTKIFHPNVSEKGEICVNTLKRDWDTKSWSLYNILEVIKCLLIIPFPGSSLNDQAGKIFMEDYAKYFKIANIFTNVHAIKNDFNLETKNTEITNQQNSNSYSTLCIETNSWENGNSNSFSKEMNFCLFNQSQTKFTETNDTDSCKFSNSSLNLNFMRHSKSLFVKHSENSNIINLTHEQNAIQRRFTEINRGMENKGTLKQLHKPSIDSLPFIRRSSASSNSNSNFFNSNIENEDGSIKSNSNILSYFNPNVERRTKKEEIKKWLSRL